MVIQKPEALKSIQQPEPDEIDFDFLPMDVIPPKQKELKYSLRDEREPPEQEYMMEDHGAVLPRAMNIDGFNRDGLNPGMNADLQEEMRPSMAGELPSS